MVNMKVDQRMTEKKINNCLESDPDRWMTIPETAKYIKVSTRTIYNYLKSGVLQQVYFGNSLRIDKIEIIAFANLQKAC